VTPRTVVLDTAFLVCGGIAWTAALYKAAALRLDRRNWALYALVAAIGLPGTAFVVAAPTVYLRVDGWFGVPNLATLIVYGCIVAYSIVALIMVLLWSSPPSRAWPPARVLLIVYAVILAIMTALFMAADVPTERPLDFDERYAADPVVGAFVLVYVAAFGCGLAAFGLHTRRFAGAVSHAGTDRRWLRRGLRIASAGSGVALGYCLGKAIAVLGAQSGQSLRWLHDLAIACAVLGAMLITAGFTMPSWGPRISAARTWAGRLIAYHRLYPLWHLMYTAAPEIALSAPTSRLTDLLTPTNLDFRLYRRMIEIQDGRLAVLPYLPRASEPAPPTTPDRAAREAWVEASRLRAAAHAVAVARRRGDTLEPAPERPDPPPSGSSPDDELRWLLKVVSALRRLPELDPRPRTAVET
jgi:hypothetical protein